MKQRKQYTKEFKQGAVRLVTDQGRSISDAATSLGISDRNLSRWLNDAKLQGSDAFRGYGIRTTQEQEIFDLRQKIKQLEEEKDILKKAAAYFAAHLK
jgi:transposase